MPGNAGQEKGGGEEGRRGKRKEAAKCRPFLAFLSCLCFFFAFASFLL